MNIFNFLNSNSVSQYLKEISYKFPAQEAAFVVWNSNKPFAEKVIAWQEIIKTMPDCTVRCRFDYPKYPSLHKFLKDYMSLVERIGGEAEEENLPEDEFYLYTAFDFMWFNIPTPFKKGDIVCSKGKHIPNYDKYVLLDISNWNRADYINNGYTDRDYKLEAIDEKLKKREEKGDYTDMSAHGYRVFCNGTIDYDFFCNYIDFEYCKESELSGNERALKTLSAYFKGEIDLELFLNAYKVILDEEKLKDEKEQLYLLGVDDESLRLMGLKR